MNLKVTRRTTHSAWTTPVAVLAAVVVTLVLVAGPIRAAGANPLAALQLYILSPLQSATGIDTVLLAATPLLFTGLAVAIAFRVGYYNIGAEGQFLAGAMGAAVPALYLANLPAVLALPLAIVCGAIGGLAWSAVPAWLKRNAGIDEVVTTLLLNPVAVLLLQGLLNGPWRNSQTGFPDSDRFGPGYTLPTLGATGRVHAGLIIALLLIGIYLAITLATPLGLRMRATGIQPHAAAFVGIDTTDLRWRAALVSGAVAGMGGASQVLGVQHQVNGSIANGYGYTGVIVATLGATSALGVLGVALLLGNITMGSQAASIVLQLPTQMGEIVSALLLLTVVAMIGVSRYTIIRPRKTDDAAHSPGSGGSPPPAEPVANPGPSAEASA